MKRIKHRAMCSIPAVTLLAVVCAVLSPGCAGYRLGTTLPPGIKTIYVPTFINRTDEPQVETEATRAAIQEFQKDGTLRLVAAEQADVHLKIVVTEYELAPLRFERDRAKTTSEYRLLLTAELEFIVTESEEVLVKKRVLGEATFEPGGDLSSAKIDALPEACEDLAHDIVESVVEFW